MILQALTQLFEDLVQRGEISKPGWAPTKISYALCLNEKGKLLQMLPLFVEVDLGKKTVLRPQEKVLPAPVMKTSGKKSNFLWENAAYVLGIGKKDAAECFAESARFHHQLLDETDSPVASAILRYFDTWDVKKAEKNTVLAPYIDELMKGANLLFRVNGVYAQEDSQIQAAWQAHYDAATGQVGHCLVTGKEDVIVATHPWIKGIVGAQSSGASLVSFNAPAFCSYGKEQSLNAPVGKYAAFAYTAALNHLLADKTNVHRLGDTTVVCWAEGAEPEYTQISNYFLFGESALMQITTNELHAIVDRLVQGLPCEEISFDPDRRFYILGLAPNAARLSVRFFYQNSFRTLMRSVIEHHKRMEIVGTTHSVIPLWSLLQETVNMNSKDKTPSPVMAGAVVRAIMTGTAYPASLLEAVHLRIRAEHEISPGRAAIIKAYYLNNPNPLCPKEVLTVSLNENSTNVPYTLGRLFAVYEAVQEKANPKINSTIKDKYFNSASATPGMIFPILDNLCQKHLRKSDDGARIYYDRMIGQIKNVLGETNPVRLSLPEQGSFNLGYYHQKQNHYMKKENK